jgi:NAD(P)H-flavin reductase
MKHTQALIERVRRVSDALQQLDLAVDRALMQIKPGQSLFAALQDPLPGGPYLREQWIPVTIQPGRLTVEISTARTYAPGQVISLLAPVGSPIPLRSGLQRLLLVVDDVYPTPLVLLARQLMSGGVAVTLVLGGRAVEYPLELLSPEIEILRSDTGWKWPEQVETLNWADQVIVWANPDHQLAVYRHLYDVIRQLRPHDLPDHLVCGLFYPRLACGAGACQSCEIPSTKETLLACSDGPAVDLKKVQF